MKTSPVVRNRLESDGPGQMDPETEQHAQWLENGLRHQHRWAPVSFLANRFTAITRFYERQAVPYPSATRQVAAPSSQYSHPHSGPRSRSRSPSYSRPHLLPRSHFRSRSHSRPHLRPSPPPPLSSAAVKTSLLQARKDVPRVQNAAVEASALQAMKDGTEARDDESPYQLERDTQVQEKTLKRRSILWMGSPVIEPTFLVPQASN